ncbi:hypothetical protein [Proteiniclasticum sp.]|uniref:hypothetical protein n=1 Tax=Proteiniclasticum sp. TaxID=2053595 RepID=UPI00289B56EC|nr:hypothetical protein [Proteiniclasticum sp.]
MSPIDKRNRLDDHPFDYVVFKNQSLQIYYNGKPVVILKDQKARDLIEKLEKAEDKDIQLILAKITGNFKRGNEKLFKKER